MNKKVGLIILDGWGIGDHGPSDAIFQAQTPFMDRLLANYPSATLRCEAVHIRRQYKAPIRSRLAFLSLQTRFYRIFQRFVRVHLLQYQGLGRQF